MAVSTKSATRVEQRVDHGTPAPLTEAKRRIVDRLKRVDDATAAELASGLGLTGAAIRQHLDALAAQRPRRGPPASRPRAEAARPRRGRSPTSPASCSPTATPISPSS